MDKAVIYARVSSKDQENEGFSIPAQVKFLHEYGSKNGFTVVKEFIDAETAKKAGRKQFNLMLNFIEENKIQHLLVEKTDRLLRNMSDYVLIKRLTNTADTSVHLAKENAILGKNANSNEKLMFGIRSVMAESYLDNLSEEVRKGMQEKALQGTYPSWAPYGYLNAKIDGKKIIVIDPDSAPYVKKLALAQQI
jgi:DNA invertase Pin-like site-specific DNA recombinase